MTTIHMARGRRRSNISSSRFPRIALTADEKRLAWNQTMRNRYRTNPAYRQYRIDYQATRQAQPGYKLERKCYDIHWRATHKQQIALLNAAYEKTPQRREYHRLWMQRKRAKV